MDIIVKIALILKRIPLFSDGIATDTILFRGRSQLAVRGVP